MKQLLEFQDAKWFYPLLFIALAWELTWKLLAMWRAAQHRQSIWFILLAVLNTIGIFPILYLLFYKGKKPLVK